MITSLGDLGNAFLFVIFVMTLFAILGLTQLSGIPLGKCKPGHTALPPAVQQLLPRLCTSDLDCPREIQCSINFKSQEGFPFQHFGYSLLSVFQILTGDGWSSILYAYSGIAPTFTPVYFLVLLLLGHFYLLQLLLAVILANLGKVQGDEAFREIAGKRALVEADKKEMEEEEKQKKAKENNPMAEMVKAIKEHKAKMAAERARLGLAADAPLPPPQEADQKQKEEAAKQKKADDQLKHNMAWSLGGKRQSLDVITEHQGTQQRQDLSKGIGLAILSKALGVQSIEDKYQHHRDNIKRTNLLKNIDLKLDLQRKIKLDIQRLQHKIDLNVIKMYWKSKKNIYGVDNELHLVEQIHKLLRTLYTPQFLKGQVVLTHKQIFQTFSENEISRKPLTLKQKENIEDVRALKLGPQIDRQMLLALKIGDSLKDLALEQNVKEFFQARFKRRLIKKSIIDKLHSKIDKFLYQSEVEKRASQNKIYLVCHIIIYSTSFKALSIICIVLNSIVLSLSNEDNKDEENVLEYINIAFFGFFVFELIVKVVGLGFKNYFQDRFNWFDSSVVLISAIDISLIYTLNSGNNQAGAITALRVFRLARILQLAKNWRDFQELLEVIFGTLKDVSSIALLFAVFVFTFMLLGMELFAYRIPAEESQSRFDNFLQSFLSVFLILANDGWSTLYQVYTNSSAQSESISTTVYFIALLVIGQMILLNLLVAVLIENFESLSVRNDLVNKLKEFKTEEGVWRKILRIVMCREKNKVKVSNKIDLLTDQQYIEQIQRKDIEEQIRRSLDVFSYNGKIRKWSNFIVKHRFFDHWMTFFIILNSLQLALDNPLSDPTSSLAKFLIACDYCFTIFFTFEAALKIIAFGLLHCGSTSYLKNSWNVLDFLVILVTCISYMSSGSNLHAVKAFRLLKVLRPIRAISKNQGLKLSIQALAVAFSGLLQILGLQILLFFIFGIIGVNYFKGQFFTCTSSSANDQWDCNNNGGTWYKMDMNFDNTYEAMITLFVISTNVQWAQVMHQASKTSESSESPIAAIFFVLFIVIGNFFMMNLYIGVIITKYNREKELQGKDLMLTDEQKNWVQKRLMIINAQPKFYMKVPLSDWRQPFYFIAQYKHFQHFIMACIILNTLALSLQWYGQSQQISDILDMINILFTMIFTAELLINLVAFGSRFFYSNWNIFDMIIVIISIIGLIVSSFLPSNYGMSNKTTIIRSFRIARIFLMFKGNESLKSTLNTFIISLPAIANIGSLLMLIIIIYAILGVYLFAEIKLNGALDEHANFQTLGRSLIIIFRILSGEEWPKLMEAVSRTRDSEFDCKYYPTYEDYTKNNFNPVGCGDRFLAKIYFYSCTLVLGMIFLRLFIAIILHNFQTSAQRDHKFMSNELCDHFRDVWSLYDPDATGFLNVRVLDKVLLLLGDPLGWDKNYEHDYLKQQEYLAELKLPKYNNQREYYFTDVFDHLVLLMIIRRELINFGMKNRRYELLNIDKKDAIESGDPDLMKSIVEEQKVKEVDLSPRLPLRKINMEEDDVMSTTDTPFKQKLNASNTMAPLRVKTQKTRRKSTLRGSSSLKNKEKKTFSINQSSIELGTITGEDQQSTLFNNRNNDDFYNSSSTSQLEEDRDEVDFDDRMNQIEDELNKIGLRGGLTKQKSVWEEQREREERAQQQLAKGQKMATMKTLMKKAMLKEDDEM